MNSLMSLEAQMAIYAAYHQDARNKATHFIGVPAIALALLIALAWLRLGDISAAMVLAAALALYYLTLDLALGAAMALVLAVLVWAAERIVAMRSEERRVGKEGRSRWSADHEEKKGVLDG